jgi:hypothetical protein
LKDIGGSRKGEKMCTITQEVGSQKCKRLMQMWTDYKLGVLRSKSGCGTNIKKILIWKSVLRKRTELWPDKWSLHHSNAPVHDVLRFCEFLAKKSITKMSHSHYSPDFVPCNFWIFQRLKIALKRQRIADIPDIQRNVTLL